MDLHRISIIADSELRMHMSGFKSKAPTHQRTVVLRWAPNRLTRVVDQKVHLDEPRFDNFGEFLDRSNVPEVQACMSGGAQRIATCLRQGVGVSRFSLGACQVQTSSLRKHMFRFWGLGFRNGTCLRCKKTRLAGADPNLTHTPAAHPILTLTDSEPERLSHTTPLA